MKSVKSIVLVGLLAISASCGNPAKDEIQQWPVDFDAIIKLNCRAIELRKARFATADSIRLKMDSVQATMDSTAFENYQARFENRKEALLIESNILADTIRLRMKRVMTDLNPEQKRAFNDSIQAEMNRRGCK